MPVDPQIGTLLTMLNDKGASPLSQDTPEAARAAYRLMTVDGRTPEQVVPVASTWDLEVPGAQGSLRARAYRPDGDGPFPAVAFFHGGGWVIGDLDTHDNMARNICRGAGAIVVSVEYRLAPEHRFPAAALDAVAAARWLAGHCRELGGDGRFAVAGDSAGGNLSAVVTQHLAREGIGVAGQLLIYPATDSVGGYPSRVENGCGYLLEQSSIKSFLDQYAGPSADPADPVLSPLHGDLSGLPPAIIVTAEFDPLRDEGEAYGKALEAAGVSADVRRYPGMIHGFFDMGTISPAAQAAIEESCALFGALLGGGR